MNIVTTVHGDKLLLRRLSLIGKDAAGAKHVASVQAGAEVIRSAAVSNIRAKLNKNSSGAMAGSMAIKMIPRAIKVVANIGLDVVYARIHEFGGDITAKSAPNLVFEVEPGVWVTTPVVTIPARPYLRPAFDSQHVAAASLVIQTFRASVLHA
jgi:phage gpG-like protein